jgi:hypothetical protein
MPCDYDTASSSLLLLVNTVFDSQTSGLDSVVQDGGIFVVSYTSKVDSRIGGKEVLGAASGVLGSSAGDELCGVVVEKVLVDSEVLFLSEDGVVGF